MRNLKRVLSLALACVMVIGMMVMTTGAADLGDYDEITNTEAVDVMVALGVLEGDDLGNFNPEQILTREQAAKIICYMLMGPRNAQKLGKNTTIFSDVAADRWSAGYIAYCNNLGIISGYDGKFDPTGELTGVAFGKMLLVALGYDATIEGYVYNDNWATNIATDMIHAGIDVNGIVLDQPLSRDNAAQMAFNTLTADLVGYSEKIQVESGNNTTTISGGRFVVENSVAVASGTYNGRVDGETQFCEEYFGLLKCTGDYDVAGRPGTAWSYKGEEIGLYLDNPSDTTTVTKWGGDTLATILTGDGYFELRDDKYIDLGNDTASVADWSGSFNGDALASGTTLTAGTVVDIYKNVYGVVTDVVALQYTLAVIDEIDTDVSMADAKKGVKAYVTLTALDGTTAVGDGVYNDKDIACFDAETYVEGAKIAVALNTASDIVDSHLTTTVTGAVSEWSSGGMMRSVKIDGEKYNRSRIEDDTVSGNYNFNKGEYAIYVDENGYALGVEGISDLKLSDLYYVYGAYWTAAANGNNSNYILTVDMDGNIAEKLVEEAEFVTLFDVGGAAGYADELASNTFTKVDALYTLSDKTHDGTNHFAGNGKYSLTAITDGAGADYDVLYVGTLALADDVNSSSTSVGATGSDFTKAYLEDTTKFILVDETAAPSANIRVTTADGTARVKQGVSSGLIIATKVGTSYVAERVIAVDDTITAGVTNIDNIVYLTGNSDTKVGGKLWQWKGYFMDGTNANINVNVGAGNGSTYGEGFYTYIINEDSEYELTSIATTAVYGTVGSLASNFVYDDETGYIPDTAVASIYNNTITLAAITDNGNTADFDDVALSDNLVVIDNRAMNVRGTDAYTLEINTLAKLQAAMKKGAVTVASFVDNGEMLFISVIDVADADLRLTVSAAAPNIAAASDESATYAIDGNVIKVAVKGTGAAAAADTVVLTVAATGANSTESATTITMTFNGTTWTAAPANVVVTAENGDTATYTVAVTYTDLT